jgi:hypothetical protein
MNRLGILAISLTLVSSSAIAQQQQTLRQQLVGTWEVVSLGNPEGANTKIVSTTPKGYVILAGSGKYNAVFRNPNRPKDAGRADGVNASFGSWSVDEGTKTLTIHVDGAMNSSAEGTEGKSTIVINGDELSTNANNFTNVFKRIHENPPISGLQED